MFVGLFVHIYTHICIRMYTYIYIHIYIYVYIYIYIYTYTYTCICVYVYTSTFTGTYTHIYICIYIGRAFRVFRVKLVRRKRASSVPVVVTFLRELVRSMKDVRYHLKVFMKRCMFLQVHTRQHSHCGCVGHCGYFVKCT